MELRQLITFQTIAQTTSFSRAALTLNYAQSTVSAQIQALEDELGVILFDRLGKRVVLTEAGQRLLSYADKMLNLADQARTAVSDEDLMVGALTISAPETLCTYRLPKVLQEFRARFPQIQLTFLPDENIADLQNRLRDNEADIAFIMVEHLNAPSLIIEPLVPEPLLLVTYPEHHLTQSSSVHPTDLRNEPALLVENWCIYRRMFEQAMNMAGVPIVSPMEFHSVEAIKQCAMAGLGYTFLPEIAVKKEIEQGRLVALNWAGRDFEVVTQLVWHKDKWLSPTLQAFMSVARELLLAEPNGLQQLAS